MAKENTKELESLSYKPKTKESVPEQPKCETCGGSGKGRLIGVKGGPNFFEPCPNCKAASAPQEAKEKTTPVIEPKTEAENKESVGQQLCKKCQVVNCICRAVILKEPEQPNQNAMIFEQANGSIKVTLELLEQLETKNTNEETQKHGCIWTLKGWHNNNLKHLQKAFE